MHEGDVLRAVRRAAPDWSRYVDAMSDEPLTNALVELAQATYLAMNVMERDEFTDQVFTDDFVFDDRRSGFSYGLLDASAYTELNRTAWDVGSSRPNWSITEVIAVRGQRIAAVAIALDYDDDVHTESIICGCLDRHLQLLRRMVQIDVDDRDAAIAEVDRMYAEIDD